MTVSDMEAAEINASLAVLFFALKLFDNDLLKCEVSAPLPKPSLLLYLFQSSQPGTHSQSAPPLALLAQYYGT